MINKIVLTSAITANVEKVRSAAATFFVPGASWVSETLINHPW
jgi:hypothetical protein